MAIVLNGSTGISTPNIDSDGAVTASGITVDNTTGAPDQALVTLQADMGVSDRNMQIRSPSTDSVTEPFRFTTGNSFAFEVDTNASALVIDSSANVGIGTSSPSAKLDVVGNAEINGNLSVSSAVPVINLLETDTSNQHRIIATGGSLYIQAQDSDGTNDGDLHLTGYVNADLNLLNIKAVTTAMNGNLTVTGTVTGDGSTLTGVYGQGQTLQDMSASRVSGTSYRNTTGKTIFVGIEKRGGGGDLQYSTNNSTWISVAGWPSSGGSYEEYYAGLPIPHNTYYRISSGGYEKWTELR